MKEIAQIKKARAEEKRRSLDRAARDAKESELTQQRAEEEKARAEKAAKQAAKERRRAARAAKAAEPTDWNSVAQSYHTYNYDDHHGTIKMAPPASVGETWS
jgi:hypothetical protein